MPQLGYRIRKDRTTWESAETLADRGGSRELLGAGRPTGGFAILGRGGLVESWGDVAILAGLLVATGLSAAMTKELLARRTTPMLAAVSGQPEPEALPRVVDPLTLGGDGTGEAGGESGPANDVGGQETAQPAVGASGDSGPGDVLPAGWVADTSVRFFNGRPVRPARTINMLVTAYSPDWRSCGDSADGITASLHDVGTNNFRLVAADTRILPLGSMISVPGYDDGKIVPVLDRGGAIKGNRLDVLFPTHREARQFGVKRLRVTVWEYADGQSAPSWREYRDSRGRAATR